MNEIPTAKFRIGQIVKHRLYAFRGVIFDVDPVFSNTEEWWNSIPEEARPRRDQPFYHLLAENDETEPACGCNWRPCAAPAGERLLHRL